jgi:UDP-N-acetylmuramoyl-tripeptide--D-alanyl-D-alanine ligase
MSPKGDADLRLVVVLTLADVCEALTGQRNEAWQTHAITSFCVDSRRCARGSLFVALKGEVTDGHLYIGDALSRGAQYVIAAQGTPLLVEARLAAGGGATGRLTDKSGLSGATQINLAQPPAANLASLGGGLSSLGGTPPIILLVANPLRALQDIAAWWRRTHCATMQVIGVTGSVGKTVTKELVAAVVSQRYRTYKSEGNLNSETGLPLALLQIEGDAAHERAVLEMGMYELGEIARLAVIVQPRIGVVTNVGPSHLERLGTLERIAQAKGELPLALPADGWAILNGDDPLVRDMPTQASVLRYGLTASNDVWASDVEGLGLGGTQFWLHHHDEAPLHVRIPLLGRHSVHTALASAAVGLVEGLTWDEIVHGLQNVQGQLRLTAATGWNGATILDDAYNASPVSCLAALNLLQQLDGRKIAVFADMLELGSYEREGHVLVGARAAEVCDMFIVVGPRARIMGESALAAGMPTGAVTFCQTKAEASALLKTLLQKGDVVLVKGSRGMKMEDVVSSLTGMQSVTAE